MRMLSLVCALLALAGCDLSRSTAPLGSASVVTGVVQLPAGVDGDACSGIGVHALSPSGDAVGRAEVHASHGRCSYEINGLPADSALTVRVESSGWHCQSGSAPAFAPQSAPVELKRDETRMVDFKATCG